MKIKRFICITITLFFVTIGYSQEYLTNFEYNLELRERLLREDMTVSLPFFDDFTDAKSFSDRWQNYDVLINSGFPLFPTNYNAVTFDILDESGKVYPNGSSNPFIADSLMSHPIRLVDDAGNRLSPADSLYLSFYYQPQGRGDAPDENDSLVLMLGIVTDTAVIWNHVWSTEGMSLDDFMENNDEKYFKQVMIPVDDERYFDNDLMILFYNYGTMPSTMYPNDRSNGDVWNVDFVYLDRNRSYDDTSYPLVSFSENSPSMLKRYQSMPYRQYVSNPTVAMKTTYEMFIANLDMEGCNTQYSCHIENINSDWVFDYNSEWCYLAPFYSSGFQNCEGDNATQACPHLKNFLFDMNSSLDSASFLITHIITVDNEDSDAKGDTLYGKQEFYNYYAYDDGIPEKGYGVTPHNSSLASQFSISVPDTLQGVQILFNRTFKDANYDFFDIVVWNDNNGKPGNEIYRLENQRPIWNDEHIYEYTYYKFEKTIKVNGIIYVGIMQHSSESINIGFDTSIDNHQYNFFESGDGWQNSMMPGSLMIRPVVGGDYFVDIDENMEIDMSLDLYPNPTSGVLKINNDVAAKCSNITIFDMMGRGVRNYHDANEINVGDLDNGMYMMRVVTDDGRCYTERFIISK